MTHYSNVTIIFIDAKMENDSTIFFFKIYSNIFIFKSQFKDYFSKNHNCKQILYLLYHIIFQVFMSVKLVSHYQHFSNFMRILTSFAIVLEFLIGFKNSSGLLMHKIWDFRIAKIHASPHNKANFFPEFWEDLT